MATSFSRGSALLTSTTSTDAYCNWLDRAGNYSSAPSSLSALGLVGASSSHHRTEETCLKHIKAGLSQETATCAALQELMSRMFLVNIPLMFAAVWKVLQMFVDDRVKAKIRFLRKADFHILHEFVDREQLPESLGGKAKEKLLSDKQGTAQTCCLSDLPLCKCILFCQNCLWRMFTLRPASLQMLCLLGLPLPLLVTSAPLTMQSPALTLSCPALHMSGAYQMPKECNQLPH